MDALPRPTEILPQPRHAFLAILQELNDITRTQFDGGKVPQQQWELRVSNRWKPDDRARAKPSARSDKASHPEERETEQRKAHQEEGYREEYFHDLYPNRGGLAIDRLGIASSEVPVRQTAPSGLNCCWGSSVRNIRATGKGGCRRRPAGPVLGPVCKP